MFTGKQRFSFKGKDAVNCHWLKVTNLKVKKNTLISDIMNFDE